MSFELDQAGQKLLLNLFWENKIPIYAWDKVCKAQSGQPQGGRLGRLKKRGIPNITTENDHTLHSGSEPHQSLPQAEHRCRVPIVFVNATTHQLESTKQLKPAGALSARMPRRYGRASSRGNPNLRHKMPDLHKQTRDLR